MGAVASSGAVTSSCAGWRRALRAALACAVGAAGVPGCSTLPGATRASIVQSVVERGGVLDAQIAREGSVQRFFAPTSEPCRKLMKKEAAIEYVSLGPLGQFRSGDTTCAPNGIGSLAVWRDQRPRPKVGPLPSRAASYQVVYQDADVAMLRGLFPMLGLIGWPGMGDTIAVVAQSPACQALIQRGSANVVYRVAGPDPYVMLDGEMQCPLEGLIQPSGER